MVLSQLLLSTWPKFDLQNVRKQIDYHLLVVKFIELAEYELKSNSQKGSKTHFRFLNFITYTVAVDGQGCFKLNELTDKFFAIHFALKPSLSCLLTLLQSHSENNHFQASKMKKSDTIIRKVAIVISLMFENFKYRSICNF